MTTEQKIAQEAQVMFDEFRHRLHKFLEFVVVANKEHNEQLVQALEPLTPEQAQKAYDKAEPVPVTEAEIERCIKFIGQSAAEKIRRAALAEAAKLVVEKIGWVAKRSDGSGLLEGTVPSWFHDLAEQIEKLGK